MIESVLIEIRPGLGMCSVCIILKEGLKEARVKVRSNVILLNVTGKDFAIPLVDFTVEPLTMTCFQVESRSISFRLSVSSCPGPNPAIRPKKVLPFQPSEVVKLACKCGCPITENIAFRRVLPLPCHGIDIADMFCHYDSHTSRTLTPRSGDCLYSTHYVCICEELLKNVKINAIIKCQRCLSVVGQKKKETVQLWNVCLNLPYGGVTPAEEFLRIIKSAVEESFVIFLKIFMECVEGSTGLLISVMDKQLLVSRAKEDLRLKTSNVVKVKYEYHKTCSSEVKAMLEEENVQCIEVPRVVLHEGLLFLTKSSEDIPPLFRTVGGELMAYLEL